MDARLKAIERRAKALGLNAGHLERGAFAEISDGTIGTKFIYAISSEKALEAAERLLALYEAGTEREHAIEHLKWPPRWYEKQVVGFITIDGEIYDMSNSPKYKAHVEVDDCQRLVSIAEFEAQTVEFELTDAVEMIALGQSRKIAINIPGGTKAGRYRLVRVGDVEVGDAR